MEENVPVKFNFTKSFVSGDPESSSYISMISNTIQ